MPSLEVAHPRISIHLFKTIARSAVAGGLKVSTRYAGQTSGGFIDLTPFLNDKSAVRTTKSVREPAGGFSITFADKPYQSQKGDPDYFAGGLETVYGLVEPMDMIEIRIWGGVGPRTGRYPIVMRGFISDIQRTQAMGPDGKPIRQVIIGGQDFGKIWQMYQILFLSAYAEGKSLLTNFALWELFGISPKNTLSAPEFIKQILDKIINPYLGKFLPAEWSTIDRKINYDAKSITVAHGVINQSYQQTQGAIYDAMRLHGDVGVWNELFTEDREDGVYCVYRAVPTIHLTRPTGAKSDLIMEDAVAPSFVNVPDDYIESLSVGRSDNNVANFFWVENSRFDLISDIQRKLASLPQNDPSVLATTYPNSALAYYGLRPMMTATQQGEDSISNLGSGQDKTANDARDAKQLSWMEKRRKQLMETNKDNVVFERGTIKMKGGLMRNDGTGMLRAGDYLNVIQGKLQWLAYAVNVSHEFMPFVGFTTTVQFERGTGFAERLQANGGVNSPWLSEQGTRSGALPTPKFVKG